MALSSLFRLLLASVFLVRDDFAVEMCMRMGKTGIPWVPWDSHGNGNKISHGMGMGIKCMGMGIKTWEWEKHCKHFQQCFCCIGLIYAHTIITND